MSVHQSLAKGACPWGSVFGIVSVCGRWIVYNIYLSNISVIYLCNILNLLFPSQIWIENFNNLVGEILSKLILMPKIIYKIIGIQKSRGGLLGVHDGTAQPQATFRAFSQLILE